MKPLYLLFFLFTLSCFSQSNNFVVKNSMLVWENVFISNETNIAELLAKYPKIRLEPVTDKIYKGSVAGTKNTCPGTSAFIDNDMSFNFEIEERPGKYRVTVTAISFTQNGKPKPAETYLVDKTQLKNTKQAQTDMECLENYLNRMFTLTQILKNKM